VRKVRYFGADWELFLRALGALLWQDGNLPDIKPFSPDLPTLAHIERL
jgi:hypothetical protein